MRALLKTRCATCAHKFNITQVAEKWKTSRETKGVGLAAFMRLREAFLRILMSSIIINIVVVGERSEIVYSSSNY